MSHLVLRQNKCKSGHVLPPNELETKFLVFRALWILELQKRVYGTESINMRKYLQMDVLEVKQILGNRLEILLMEIP